MFENDDNELYLLFGADYISIPEELRQLLLNVYARSSEIKELLLPLEKGIKDEYDRYMRSDHWYETSKSKSEECRCLQILLKARKQVLNKMFHLTANTYNQFLCINNTLKDLSYKTCKKIEALYQSWLKDEEADWRNDCQVSGRIFAEGWQEIGTDDTGSDYNTMIQIIEEVDRRNLFTVDFSGFPDFNSIDCIQWDNRIDSCRLFNFGGPNPYGDFTMCRAFNTLYTDSLYSNQDILRIKMFWADVALIHQRIVTPQGELL